MRQKATTGAPVRSEPKRREGLGVPALDERGDREQLGGRHDALAAAPVDPYLEHPPPFDLHIVRPKGPVRHRSGHRAACGKAAHVRGTTHATRSLPTMVAAARGRRRCVARSPPSVTAGSRACGAPA